MFRYITLMLRLRRPVSSLPACVSAQDPRQGAGHLGGAPIHRSRVVKAFLKQTTAKRLSLEQLRHKWEIVRACSRQGGYLI
jgi:hypothetical protein